MLLISICEWDVVQEKKGYMHKPSSFQCESDAYIESTLLGAHQRPYHVHGMCVRAIIIVHTSPFVYTSGKIISMK